MGDSLEDIKMKAKVLQNEICVSLYQGQSPQSMTIKFEYGNEILI